MNGPPHDTRTGGDDAVCFTAGTKGFAFGAGVIHAWLAADRRPPSAAAGISVGALSAAAMRYAYRHLEKVGETGDLEVRRWRWFRKYLRLLSHSPLDVIWRAIPNPVDFFTDKPPVVDLSCPSVLAKSEAESRRHHHILTKFGIWLAGNPTKVSSIASAIINYVRWKDRYGAWILSGLWCLIMQAKVAAHLLYKFCFPPFFSERSFRVPESKPASSKFMLAPRWFRFHIWSWRVRPLFGWKIWLASLFFSVLLIVAVSALAVCLSVVLARIPAPFSLFGLVFTATQVARAKMYLGMVAALLAVLGLVCFLCGRTTVFRWATSQFLNGLGLTHGVLNDYHLHRTLLELFAESSDDPQEPKVGDDDIQLVLVATPLQEVTRLGRPIHNREIWAGPDTLLTTALRAALSVPGVFPPVRLAKREEIESWIGCENVTHLDLVDGAQVSENPLSALFGWLKDHPDIAEKLSATETKDCKVHLVYSLPIGHHPGEHRAQAERMNVVEVARVSRELAKRRDNRQDTRQTNFMSELELYIRQAGGSTEVFPIFVDEIAPEHEIAFHNNLDPTTEEIRKTAAAGCRRTLEQLYRRELGAMGKSLVPCHELLARVAPRRARSVLEKSPGLLEVCSSCTRKLQYRKESEPSSKDSIQTYGREKGKTDLLEDFGHLSRKEPRIVFLASGGVFRGSFHSGVIAAMSALQIRPDLVVGASVGALMGGALAAMSITDHTETGKLLEQVASTFLRADERVALTRTLKNASKQLGTRARRIHLSPSKLRAMVRRGAEKDAGYAALGAPPALIDAFSKLLFIPHDRSRSIASEFVAGHITSAVARFWHQVEKETLPSLDIEHAVIGTSLLEPLARQLLGQYLGIPLGTAQPYHQNNSLKMDGNGAAVSRLAHSVSFFCTASDLRMRRSLLLGRDFLNSGDFIRDEGSYDFVNAALSSIAFPVIFAPRTEAEIMPGSGREDVLLADGGMFDNMPFYPALDLLGAMQTEYRNRCRAGDGEEKSRAEALAFLAERQEVPDLLIAAGLDAPAGYQPISGRSNLSDNFARVKSFGKNVKSSSFAYLSDRVGKQAQALLEQTLSTSRNKEAISFGNGFVPFIDSIVSAGVLQIFPTDAEHVNQTFAFSRSIGMNKDRVRRSIADGCFQTMLSIAEAQTESNGKIRRAREQHGSATLKTSIRALTGSRVPALKIVNRHDVMSDKECAFFRRERTNASDSEDIPCPFMAPEIKDRDVRQIRHVCARDPQHQFVMSPRSSSGTGTKG